jgi:hypothetical protein
MAEKDLHKKLRDWAYETYGEIKPPLWRDEPVQGLIKIVKMTMLAQYGEAGAPDWAVFVRAQKKSEPGYVFFFELKDPDNKYAECTDKQLHYHEQLRTLGFNVYVVRDFMKGKELFEREIANVWGTRKPLRSVPVTHR